MMKNITDRTASKPLLAATLLALHRRAFAMAGLFALLSALLRPVGAVLLVPIVVELVRSRPRPAWPAAVAAEPLQR